MARQWGMNFKLVTVLAVLVLTGMVLINAVHLAHIRQQHIEESITVGRLLIATTIQRSMRDPSSPLLGGDFQELLNTASFRCAYIFDRRGDMKVQGGDCLAPIDITGVVKKAVTDQKVFVRSFGSTWGVYWFNSKYLVIVEPFPPGERMAAVCVVKDLAPIYRRFQAEQSGVLGFIAFNTLVLTAFGGYRLWRLMIRPAEQLAIRAESVPSDSDAFFHMGNDASIFGRLSQNLNRMIGQMADDKESLRHTVVALQQANAELQQAQQDMLRAETLAAIGRLSSGIAHEIGNPIGIITGYMDLLRSGDLSESDRADCLERVQSEVARIHEIIRQLLDYARTEDQICADVSVHDLLTEMTSGLATQPMLAAVDVSFAPSAPQDTVCIDIGQLRQVFLNLMINAADAVATVSPEAGGRIGIDTQVADGPATDAPTLVVGFTDNGPGIDKSIIDKVFEPFFTTKAPGKGTGLGLWVSAMMVERFQGRLLAKTVPGGGCRFEVHLPLTAGSLSSDVASSNDLPPTVSEEGEQNGDPC